MMINDVKFSMPLNRNKIENIFEVYDELFKNQIMNNLDNSPYEISILVYLLDNLKYLLKK